LVLGRPKARSPSFHRPFFLSTSTPTVLLEHVDAFETLEDIALGADLGGTLEAAVHGHGGSPSVVS